MLLLCAVLVTALTASALWLALRRDLRLPVTVALTAVAYNALVVALKLVFGPLGLYDENARREFDETFNLSSAWNAVTAAALVLALYLGAFWLLYRLVRRRLLAPTIQTKTAQRVGIGVAAAVLILAVGGGGLLLLPLLVVGAGVDYLDFVFSSAWSLVVGVAVALAAGLAALALRGAQEQADAIGDATVLVTFFWIGVAFLTLYHVLWVVYILVLTAIWPLKTVSPK